MITVPLIDETTGRKHNVCIEVTSSTVTVTHARDVKKDRAWRRMVAVEFCDDQMFATAFDRTSDAPQARVQLNRSKPAREAQEGDRPIWHGLGILPGCQEEQE